MDWTTIVLALIALASPLLLAWQLNRNARAMRLEDYARQDAVAKALGDAADKVAVEVRDTADRLKVTDERVAQARAETKGQLVEIHGLVNSQMTEAKKAELNALVLLLAANREIADMRRARGEEPNTETQAAIKSTEAAIIELETVIADRQKAAEGIAKQKQTAA